MKLLFHILTQPGFLFFYVVSVIQICNNDLTPFYNWIHIAPIAFYSFFRMGKELVLDKKKHFKGEGIVTCSKLTRKKVIPTTGGTKECHWEELEAGDLIVLYEGDYVPADMVIFDSSETSNKRKVCYVSTKLIDGNKDIQYKYATKIMQFGTAGSKESDNVSEYKKYLTGKVEYERPSRNLYEFNGIINLSKDPKAEVLTNENFIMKYSKIKHTNWVIGLVVYAGKHTKVQMNCSYNKKLSNNGYRLVEKFNIIMLLIVLLLSLISTVGWMGKSAIIGYIQSYETYIDSGMKFWFYVVQYANFVPITIYFTLDVIEIIHYKKSRFQHTQAKRRHFVQVYNTQVLGNLGLIDYVIMEEAALKLQNKLKVKSVYIHKRLYNLRQDDLQVKVLNAIEKSPRFDDKDLSWDRSQDDKSIADEPERNEIKGSEAESLLQVNMMNTQHRVNKSPTIMQLEMKKQTPVEKEEQVNLESVDIENLGNEEFARDILDPNLDELLKAILLCSEAKTLKMTGKLNDVVMTNSQEEKTLLHLAKTCQYWIESSPTETNSLLKIRIRNTIHEFQVLGHSDHVEESDKFSVVVCPIYKGTLQLDHVHLYSKGPYDEMRQLLSLDARRATQLDLAIDNLLTNGTRPYLFARRKLTREETRGFVKTYKNLKQNLSLQEESLITLFDELEDNLKFIGMCGIEQQTFSNSYETVKLIKESAINLWVVSNQPYEKILVPLNQYGLFSTEINNQFFIDGDSPEQVYLKVKNHIEQFQRIYESEKRLQNAPEINKTGLNFKQLSEALLSRLKNYVVIISGRALSFVKTDKASYDNLALLCGISGRVVGFECGPEEKAELVNIIKKRFPEESQTVMSIGTTLSDVLMCNTADVGVITTNFKENPLIPWSDIKISDITKIGTLLFKKGVAFSHQVDHAIYYLYYKSTVMTVPLFSYNWYNSLTGSSIHDSVLLFLFFNLFTLFPLLSFCYEEVFPTEYMFLFPALYVESKYKKYSTYKKFIWRSIIEGVSHAVLIFYVALYQVGQSAKEDGKTTGFNVISLFVVFCLVFIVNCKIYFHFGKSIMLFWTSVLWSLTLFFGFFWVNIVGHFTESRTADIEMQQIIERPNIILSVLMVIFVSLMSSYIMNNLLIEREVAHPWNVLRMKFRKGKIQEISNQEILRVSDSKWNLMLLVKSVYKHSATVEGFIFECIIFQTKLNTLVLTSIGTSTSFGLEKWTLRFRDRALEKKYMNAKVNSSMALNKIIYYTGTVFFTIWSIILTTTNNDAFAFARFIICVFLVGFCFFTMTRKYQRHFSLINFLLASSLIIIKLVFDFLGNNDGSLVTALFSMVLSTFLSLEIYYTISLNVILLAVFFIRQGQVYGNDEAAYEFYILASEYLLLTALGVISIYLGAQIEKQKRVEFLAYIQIDNKSSTYNNILSLLVPNFVKNLLNKNIKYLAEDQGNVTILFCDICDFDKIMGLKGNAVVEILDNLWRQFDKLCLENGLQKIETVGKTYMACGGLKSTEKEFGRKFARLNSTKRVLNMAIGMMRYVDELILEDGGKIKLKIGIHYGRVIAGIIGYHKPQFSLIGDTVNTTSRCCSTGEDGRIILSEQAYQQLGGTHHKFEQNPVEAKGKGIMMTYVLVKLKEERKNLTYALFNDRNKSVRADASHDHEVAQDGIRRLQGAAPKDTSDQKVQRLKTEERLVEYNPEFEDDDIDKRTVQLEPSKLCLIVPNTPLKGTFRNQRSKKYRKRYILAVFFLATVYLFESLLMLTVRGFLGLGPGFIAARGAGSFGLYLMILGTKFIDARNKFYVGLLYAFLMYLTTLLAIQSEQALVGSVWFHRITMLELTFVLIVGMNTTKFTFVNANIFYFIYTIVWIAFFAVNIYLDFEYAFYYFIFAFYTLANLYITETNEIKRFNIGLKQNQKTYEQDSLVSQLLPIHALDKLLRINKMVSLVDLTDTLEDATLLFADIAGFTSFSSKVEPEEVVQMLSQLFYQFDQMCVKLKVYKVYTIGDCYVAMGCLNKNERKPEEEAYNMLQLGINMIEIIQRVKGDFPELNMRIGLHTGKVVGGIIGTEIVRYDLYGPDVLLANKMESNGKIGMIHVSESTKKMLEKNPAVVGHYRFEKHADVYLKALKKSYSGFLVYLAEGGERQLTIE